jgi:hypothetical protein
MGGRGASSGSKGAAGAAKTAASAAKSKVLAGAGNASAAVASQLGAQAKSGQRTLDQIIAEAKGAPGLSPTLKAASSMKGVPTGADFGKLATSAANAVPMSQRFGDRKTFVADAFTAAKKAAPGLTLEDFKSGLLKAQRDGHVRLSRADLVGAMDAKKVASSLIESGTATFHFILNTDVGK